MFINTIRTGSIALTNFAANGAIGTAAATVNLSSDFTINQTTAGISLTIPSPTGATREIVTIENIGTASVTVAGVVILAAGQQMFRFNGTVWKPYATPKTYNVQALNVTGSVTTWDSTVTSNSATAITVTLPSAILADVGKEIAIKNNGVGTVTIAPFAGDTITGQTSIPTGGAVTYTITAATVVNSTSSIDVSPTIQNLTYGRVNASADLANVSYSITAPGTKIPFNATVYSSGMTFSGTDSIVPSVAGRYRADFFAQAGSGQFNGNGTFHIVQGGVSLGSVYVDMMEAAGVNQTTPTIDVALAAGTAVELRFQPDIADSIIWQRGSYFQLTQLPTAVAPVVNTVAEYGEVIISSTIAPAVTSNTLVGTVTLPSAGTWQVNYVANLTHSYENSTTFKQATALLYFRDSLGNIVPDSYAIGGELLQSAATSNDGLEIKREVANGSMQVTTTGATTYTLRIDTGGGGGNQAVTVNSGSSGSSKITYQKIAGQLPAAAFVGATSTANGTSGLVPMPLLGQQNSFLKADGTWAQPAGSAVAEYGENNAITNAQTNTSNTFTDVAGSEFTLPTAGVWEVNYALYTQNTNNSTGNYRMVDVTNGNVLVPQSEIRKADVAGNFYLLAEQTVRITTTGANVYKLQWLTSSGTLMLSNDTEGRSKVSWKKIAGQLPANIIDNTTSGYFDIGNMRMQWGSNTVAALATLTFPAAFANTNYSFNATILTSITAVVTSDGPRTTTSTTVRSYFAPDGGPSGSVTYNWFAIGQKP